MIAVQHYRDIAELTRIVEAFEAGSLAATRWDHAAMLTMALWYLRRFEEPVAVDRLINGIRRLTRAHASDRRAGVGYHETMTLFWFCVARKYLGSTSPSTPVLVLFNLFIERYGDRHELVGEYYSKRLLRSWRARHTWVEPDLRPMDL